MSAIILLDFNYSPLLAISFMTLTSKGIYIDSTMIVNLAKIVEVNNHIKISANMYVNKKCIIMIFSHGGESCLDNSKLERKLQNVHIDYFTEFLVSYGNTTMLTNKYKSEENHFLSSTTLFHTPPFQYSLT